MILTITLTLATVILIAGQDVVYDKSQAMVIEKQGILIQQQGIIMIPIIHRFPDIIDMYNRTVHCNHSADRYELIRRTVLHLIKDVPENYINPLIKGRSKRFITAFAAAVGLAGSIWSSVEVRRIRETVREMSSYISQNRYDIEKLEDQVAHLDFNQGRLYKIMNELTDTVVGLARDISCQIEDQDFTLSAVTSLLVSGPTEIKRVSDEALQGKLTVNLLPWRHLQYMLKTHLELQGSLYASLPHIIYELGSFFLTSISKDPPIINGLIMLPRLVTERTGTLYSISVTQIDDAGSVVDIPQKLSSSSIASKISSLDEQYCSHHQGYTLCPMNRVHDLDIPCFVNLLQQPSGSPPCPLPRIQMPDYPRVVQTRFGVLVAANTTDITSLRFGGGRSIITSLLPNRPYPQFITQNVSDSLVYKGAQYPITSEEVDIEHVMFDGTQHHEQVQMIPPTHHHEREGMRTVAKVRRLDASVGCDHTILYCSVISLYVILAVPYILKRVRTAIHRRVEESNGGPEIPIVSAC